MTVVMTLTIAAITNKIAITIIADPIMLRSLVKDIHTPQLPTKCGVEGLGSDADIGIRHPVWSVGPGTEKMFELADIHLY